MRSMQSVAYIFQHLFFLLFRGVCINILLLFCVLQRYDMGERLWILTTFFYHFFPSQLLSWNLKNLNDPIRFRRRLYVLLDLLKSFFSAALFASQYTFMQKRMNPEINRARRSLKTRPATTFPTLSIQPIDRTFGHRDTVQKEMQYQEADDTMY